MVLILSSQRGRAVWGWRWEDLRLAVLFGLGRSNGVKHFDDDSCLILMQVIDEQGPPTCSRKCQQFRQFKVSRGWRRIGMMAVACETTRGGRQGGGRRASRLSWPARNRPQLRPAVCRPLSAGVAGQDRRRLRLFRFSPRATVGQGGSCAANYIWTCTGHSRFSSATRRAWRLGAWSSIALTSKSKLRASSSIHWCRWGKLGAFPPMRSPLSCTRLLSIPGTLCAYSAGVESRKPLSEGPNWALASLARLWSLPRRYSLCWSQL